MMALLARKTAMAALSLACKQSIGRCCNGGGRFVAKDHEKCNLECVTSILTIASGAHNPS